MNHPERRAHPRTSGGALAVRVGCCAVKAPADDPATLERFEGALDLVDSVARRIRRMVEHSIESDELLAYGREGLLDAARRYDADRGVPFRAFAYFRVRGAMIDGVRSLGRLPRRKYRMLQAAAAATRTSEGAAEDVHAPPPPGSTAAHADAALAAHLGAMATAMAAGLIARTAHGDDGDRIAVASGDDPEESVANAELLHLVRDAVEGLEDPERELVRRHYFGGERFDLVAAELGLSKSWASRLHSRAITRLTKRLKSLRR